MKLLFTLGDEDMSSRPARAVKGGGPGWVFSEAAGLGVTDRPAGVTEVTAGGRGARRLVVFSAAPPAVD